MSKAIHNVYGIALVGGTGQEASAQSMGFKAWNLARMADFGLPVPQGFVLGTALCAEHLADPQKSRQRLRGLLDAQMVRLEAACGLEFGAERKPLLVSVRSGAPVSMPGMMDTVLNVGLAESTLRGLMRLTGNPRMVWDSYRRLIAQFAEIVHGVHPAPFRAALDVAMDRAHVARAQELDFQSLAALARDYLDLFEAQTGVAFPQDPLEQLEAATAAVFDSWMSARAVEYRRMHDIRDDIGTAVTVQRMVFGNAGGTSGSGVGFTRDPATGENRMYLDFRFNSQGEDIVSGRHDANDAARLATALPGAAGQLQSLRRTLEREFGDAQEFEFTVQDGVLWMLQTRSAKRTPWAALRIAVEQVRAGELQPAEALHRLDGIDLARIERRRIEGDTASSILASATAASIGVISGVIALDPDAVQAQVAAGRQAILVREDTSTADLVGIAAASGILTARGGRTAHAAVVARQLGKACLVGCGTLRVDPATRTLWFGAKQLREGEVLTLDCDNGHVLIGEVRAIVERPTEWLHEVARWSRPAV
jgi:pyruvate,orthophosphate dikinase